MKKVIALKDYSDNYYILREGMIYNLIDSIADQLIEKEVCAVSTGSPDDVAIVPSVTSGTEIADIKINGQSNKIYAPTSSSSDGFSNLLNFSNLLQQDFNTTPSTKYISKADVEEVLATMPTIACYAFAAEIDNSIQVETTYFYLIFRKTKDGEAQTLIYTNTPGDPALTEIYTGIEFDKEFCVKLGSNSYVYNSNTERYELGYAPIVDQTGGK